MTNPQPKDVPTSLIEQLSHLVPRNHRSDEEKQAGFEMMLDLQGYDTSDPAWVKAVIKRAAKVIHAERASFGAVSALLDIHITNKAIGEAIGMATSTVQAVGAGRIVERLTEDQRRRMHRLIDAIGEQLDVVREALGN